jgi:hypothetical protein
MLACWDGWLVYQTVSSKRGLMYVRVCVCQVCDLYADGWQAVALGERG